MKQSLKDQFKLSHELEYNDLYVEFLYSPASDKLITAYQQRGELNAE